MPNDNLQEPTEDDLYLAKMTMDEVGADIDQHGHVAVTEDNRTQDPFTTKGSLANALDEALDYSNPNYDPTNESQGEVEGVTQDPQNDSPKSSDTEIKPDDTTMDKAPELPESMDNNNEKTKKDSLAEALDSVVAMDAVTEVPGEADDDAHHKWEKEEIDKRVPTLPKSLGGEEKTDGNGLVYLEYTFTVDPTKYRSANYEPIANAGAIGANNNVSGAGNEPHLVTKEELFSSVSNDKVDEEVKVDEKVEEEEPTAKEEKEAAVEANEEKAEHDSLGKPIEEKGGVKEQTKEEKEAEDEAIAKGLIDFATFIDGSSFLCNDEVSGIDYSKIAMDAGPKKAPTKQNCKTTFAQCRAKNPLYCRFHGPKLLEKDIKTAISAALGKGCVVSVTKDKGNKNPLAFRLTVGCPPQMKKDVEQTIHWYMTNVPGISSPEEYKDLGNGKETTEFEMDVLKADEPPKKSETKAQVAEYEVEKATAGNKKMAVVGETPPSIEKKAANAEVSHKFGEEEPTQVASQGGEGENAPESQETKADETDAENVNAQEVLASMGDFGGKQDKGLESTTPEDDDLLMPPSEESGTNDPQKDENYLANVEKHKGMMLDKQFSDLADKAAEQELFYNPDFKAKYDSINNSGDEMEKKIENLSALLDEFSDKGSGNDNKETSANAPSGFHFVDDAAMKMESEIKDLAQENPELISGDDNVSALYYAAQTAIDEMNLNKQGLDEIDAKIKAMGDNDFEMGASGIIEKKTLEMAKKHQQEYYDEAKTHAEISVKDFKATVESAKNNIVDGIKGIQAGNVEDIVKTTAMAIFPQGKPDGVETVADMIDAIYEELGNSAVKQFGETVEGADKYSGLKEKYLVGQKYNAVSVASLEFDAAVKNFKTEIDNAKDEASAKGLRSAVKEISDKAIALKDAFFVYKAAVDATKKEIETSAAVEAAKKKLVSSGGGTSGAGNMGGSTKQSIKEKLAGMSMKEKLPYAIKALKKKLAQDPSNADLQKKLKVYEKKLEELSKDDDYLE